MCQGLSESQTKYCDKRPIAEKPLWTRKDARATPKMPTVCRLEFRAGLGSQKRCPSSFPANTWRCEPLTSAVSASVNLCVLDFSLNASSRSASFGALSWLRILVHVVTDMPRLPSKRTSLVLQVRPETPTTFSERSATKASLRLLANSDSR